MNQAGVRIKMTRGSSKGGRRETEVWRILKALERIRRTMKERTVRETKTSRRGEKTQKSPVADASRTWEKAKAKRRLRKTSQIHGRAEKTTRIRRGKTESHRRAKTVRERRRETKVRPGRDHSIYLPTLRDPMFVPQGHLIHCSSVLPARPSVRANI